VIEAAGGVVVRDGCVLLIHRDRYDDWSLPKGKLEPGETSEEAALREVEEETGVRGTLGAYLGQTSYTTSLGEKVVRWWAMSSDDEAGTSDEVDAVEWVALAEAPRRLTYAGDRDVVSRLR
jgi:8-oxo-dGTP diphosphatase